MELTDLEICKRISEVEGFEYYRLTDQGYMAFNEGINNSITDRVFFNPLTDDALIKNLMFDYEVTIIWSRKKVMMYYKPNINPLKTVIIDFVDKEHLNKAICLAIIEANKEN